MVMDKRIGFPGKVFCIAAFLCMVTPAWAGTFPESVPDAATTEAHAIVTDTVLDPLPDESELLEGADVDQFVATATAFGDAVGTTADAERRQELHATAQTLPPLWRLYLTTLLESATERAETTNRVFADGELSESELEQLDSAQQSTLEAAQSLVQVLLPSAVPASGGGDGPAGDDGVPHCTEDNDDLECYLLGEVERNTGTLPWILDWPQVMRLDLTIEDNVHTEDYPLQVDLGGDDQYRNAAGAAHGLWAEEGRDTGSRLLIDVAGDDTYDPQGAELHYRAFGGAALNGVGALVDGSGDDTYHVVSERYIGYLAFGSAVEGVGTLLDMGGHDHYEVEVQGRAFAFGSAGNLGSGQLSDLAGDDIYRLIGEGKYSDVYAFASVDSFGYGLFFDRLGDDRYEDLIRCTTNSCGATMASIDGYTEYGHNLEWQIRPPVMIDLKGDDIYKACRSDPDRLGRGGILFDGGGQDAYYDGVGPDGTCADPIWDETTYEVGGYGHIDQVARLGTGFSVVGEPASKSPAMVCTPGTQTDPFLTGIWDPDAFTDIHCTKDPSAVAEHANYCAFSPWRLGLDPQASLQACLDEAEGDTAVAPESLKEASVGGVNVGPLFDLLEDPSLGPAAEMVALLEKVTEDGQQATLASDLDESKPSTHNGFVYWLQGGRLFVKDLLTQSVGPIGSGNDVVDYGVSGGDVAWLDSTGTLHLENTHDGSLSVLAEGVQDVVMDHVRVVWTDGTDIFSHDLEQGDTKRYDVTKLSGRTLPWQQGNTLVKDEWTIGVERLSLSGDRVAFITTNNFHYPGSHHDGWSRYKQEVVPAVLDLATRTMQVINPSYRMNWCDWSNQGDSPRGSWLIMKSRVNTPTTDVALDGNWLFFKEGGRVWGADNCDGWLKPVGVQAADVGTGNPNTYNVGDDGDARTGIDASHGIVAWETSGEHLWVTGDNPAREVRVRDWSTNQALLTVCELWNPDCDGDILGLGYICGPLCSDYFSDDVLVRSTSHPVPETAHRIEPAIHGNTIVWTECPVAPDSEPCIDGDVHVATITDPDRLMNTGTGGLEYCYGAGEHGEAPETIFSTEVGAPDQNLDGLGDCWAGHYGQMLGEALDTVTDLDCDRLNNLEEFRWKLLPIYDVPPAYCFPDDLPSLEGVVVFANGRDHDQDFLIDGWETAYIEAVHGGSALQVQDALDLLPDTVENGAEYTFYHPLHDVDSDGDGIRDLDDRHSDGALNGGLGDTIMDGIEFWIFNSFPDHGDSDCDMQANTCVGPQEMTREVDPELPSESQGTGNGASDSLEVLYWTAIDIIGRGKSAYDALWFSEYDVGVRCDDHSDPLCPIDEIDNVLLDPDPTGSHLTLVEKMPNLFDCLSEYDFPVGPQHSDGPPGQPMAGGLVGTFTSVDGTEYPLTLDGIVEDVRTRYADEGRQCDPNAQQAKTWGPNPLGDCLQPGTWDSDGDDVSDGVELLLGTDPCESKDTPSNKTLDSLRQELLETGLTVREQLEIAGIVNTGGIL